MTDGRKSNCFQKRAPIFLFVNFYTHINDKSFFQKRPNFIDMRCHLDFFCQAQRLFVVAITSNKMHKVFENLFEICHLAA
jgi:hypothetical protein